MGVNDGNGQRQLVLALMVVGNDQVNAKLVTQLGFRNGGDAAVHGDNQFYALLMQIVDGDGVEPVALLQPSGDVADAVGTAAAQKIRQ